jgi:hypothetical protein
MDAGPAIAADALFQALEKPAQIFPNLGKNRAKSSKPWKKSRLFFPMPGKTDPFLFQSLEKPNTAGSETRPTEARNLFCHFDVPSLEINHETAPVPLPARHDRDRARPATGGEL